MTFEEMLQEYFLEKLEEKPDLKIEDIFRDKSMDNAWLEDQQQEDVKEAIRSRFEKKDQDDFEIVSIDTVEETKK